MDAIWIAAGLGTLIGLTLAFTGAGGSILAIPLLVLGLHLPLQQAAPVGLAAVGLASGIGAMVEHFQGIVRYRAAGLIGAFGFVAAPFGVALAQLLPNRSLLVAFAVLMAYVAWRILRPPVDAPILRPAATVPCKVNPAEGRIVWTARCARTLAATGAASGLLSGLLGVGGGFVIVPALMRHTDLDIRSIQSTSLAVIAVVSISALAAAAWHGSLNWSVAVPFASSASIVLLMGRRFARGLPAERLKQAFAWLSLGVAAMMLARSSGVI